MTDGEQQERSVYRIPLSCAVGWHEYREHVVGESPQGWDIIDVVCPECGKRLKAREVVHNPDGESYNGIA